MILRRNQQQIAVPRLSVTGAWCIPCGGPDDSWVNHFFFFFGGGGGVIRYIYIYVHT